MTRVSTVSYILRNIDPALWRRVRRRVGAEGSTIREVMLLLLEEFAAGRLKLETTAPTLVKTRRRGSDSDSPGA
jgi:hypothetical protein